MRFNNDTPIKDLKDTDIFLIKDANVDSQLFSTTEGNIKTDVRKVTAPLVPTNIPNNESCPGEIKAYVGGIDILWNNIEYPYVVVDLTNNADVSNSFVLDFSDNDIINREHKQISFCNIDLFTDSTYKNEITDYSPYIDYYVKVKLFCKFGDNATPTIVTTWLRPAANRKLARYSYTFQKWINGIFHVYGSVSSPVLNVYYENYPVAATFTTNITPTTSITLDDSDYTTIFNDSTIGSLGTTVEIINNCSTKTGTVELQKLNKDTSITIVNSSISKQDLTINSVDANEKYTIGNGEYVIATFNAALSNWTISINEDNETTLPLTGGVGTNSVIQLSQYNSNSATGIGSLAFGESTNAANSYEIAMGTCNLSIKEGDSSKDTVITYGNGVIERDGIYRSNLFEIKSNGDIYLKGVGNYNGINAPGDDTDSDNDSGNTIAQSLQSVLITADSETVYADGSKGLKISGDGPTGNLTLNDGHGTKQLELYSTSGFTHLNLGNTTTDTFIQSNSIVVDMCNPTNKRIDVTHYASDGVTQVSDSLAYTSDIQTATTAEIDALFA